MSDKPSLYVVEKREVVILVILFVLVTVLSFTMGVRYGESVGKKAAQEKALAEEEAGAGDAETVGGVLGESSATGAAQGAKSAESAGGELSMEKTSNPPAKEVADKNSDAFLLDALKEAGIEPPGGEAPQNAKLPQEVKRVESGMYVVQVGSHPTRNEAERQVRQLKTKNVEAQILPPFKDKQGEWHRVIEGTYKTKREAERVATRLKSRGAITSFFVWRHP